jgi:NAD(P)-dependent dehydrogenase (short-subunit alcohol dehydrogenase family)
VVTIASQAAVIGIEGYVAYSASKAGLIGMTNCMAIEWGPFGVTANCISPTVVETELARGPAAEIVVDRAARWQILGQRRPLTARTEGVHQTIDDGIVNLSERRAEESRFF